MRRMNEKLVAQRLLALLAGGLLLLNFPMVKVWMQDVQWGGWPLFPLALYGVWVALIGVLAWIMERSPD